MVFLIFASANGTETLEPMLRHLACVERPPGLSIVAVDNASRDGTRTLLTSWQDRLPLDVLFEERPGKNHALNRALAHIGADIHAAELVVFTDDDVLPEPDWLTALLAAAPRWRSGEPSACARAEAGAGALAHGVRPRRAVNPSRTTSRGGIHDEAVMV